MMSVLRDPISARRAREGDPRWPRRQRSSRRKWKNPWGGSAPEAAKKKKARKKGGGKFGGRFLAPILGIVVVALVVVLVIGYLTKDGSGKIVDSDFVSSKIEECSDLTTAELIWRGLYQYEKGDITIINKSGFNMLYTATVRAGIDISEVQVDVTDSTISIVLPEPTIQSVSVDSDSLEFYDKQFSIFNSNDPESTAEALALAEDDVRANAKKTGLLDSAEEQAIASMESLFSIFAEEGFGSDGNGYEIEVTVAG